MIPRLYLEVADTPESREMGLMYRKRLGQNNGMLFQFSSPSLLSFWMKNTYVPLDIAFLDANRCISEIHEMMPHSLRSVRSSVASKEAVEVNAGWFESHGIKPGYRILTAQEEPDAPPVDAPPAAKTQAPAPHPAAVMNIAIKDAIPYVNGYGLSIEFDYNFPKGTHETYVMSPLPQRPCSIKAGAEHGDLLLGPCVHSDGEYRQFIIDYITRYDFFETTGNRPGAHVAISPAGKLVPFEANAPVPVKGEPVTTTGRAWARLLRESGGRGLSDVMSSRYSEEIRRLRRLGKTEGQALMECLAGL